MALPAISQELLDQSLYAYYNTPAPEFHSFKLLHLDEFTITITWQEVAGPRVEAKFRLNEQGPELLWGEVH